MSYVEFCLGKWSLNQDSACEAEEKFWEHKKWQQKLETLPPGCILVIGYAPSVLLTACEAVNLGKISPSLIIGLPLGFSHAPAAKRRLQQLPIEYITVEGSFAGGGVSLGCLKCDRRIIVI